jgi:hypothetical protein
VVQADVYQGDVHVATGLFTCIILAPAGARVP